MASTMCDEHPENDLVVKVVVALVHLLQSEAPLVLHVDVGVELPLCSLHELTGTIKKFQFRTEKDAQRGKEQ